MGCMSSKSAGPDGVVLEKKGEATTADKLSTLWPAYESKMKAEGLSEAAIAAFRYNLSMLTSGANLMIAESDISAVDSL